MILLWVWVITNDDSKWVADGAGRLVADKCSPFLEFVREWQRWLHAVNLIILLEEMLFLGRKRQNRHTVVIDSVRPSIKWRLLLPLLVNLAVSWIRFVWFVLEDRTTMLSTRTHKILVKMNFFLIRVWRVGGECRRGWGVLVWLNGDDVKIKVNIKSWRQLLLFDWSLLKWVKVLCVSEESGTRGFL